MGNELLWKKYLFGPSKYKKNLKFEKSHIYWVLEASKVKSDFSVYFSIEKSYSKKVFCIINLVHWQVYRVEKVGIYLHSLEKKSIFSFLHIPILGYTFELLFTDGVTSDQETVIFFEFSIVELTILRWHFFYLGLILRNFLLQSWNSSKTPLEPVL